MELSKQGRSSKVIMKPIGQVVKTVSIIISILHRLLDGGLEEEAGHVQVMSLRMRLNFMAEARVLFHERPALDDVFDQIAR
ncbi:MAG: hypothetical protein AB2L11_03365 [Syntrophobacteraceae bacterium]